MAAVVTNMLQLDEVGEADQWWITLVVFVLDGDARSELNLPTTAVVGQHVLGDSTNHTKLDLSSSLAHAALRNHMQLVKPNEQVFWTFTAVNGIINLRSKYRNSRW